MDNFWENRNVFITGSTGFLGSYLTDELIRRKATVTSLVRDWVSRSRFIFSDANKKVNVIRGEIEDYALLERILNEYEIEVVFHLAAQTIVETANRNPLSTFEANIRGTWNLLEACRRNPLVKRIIVASSDKAYGVQKELPYSESTPLQGNHPYDASKSCADLIAYTYFNTYKSPVCITRCGNFYGGGDNNFNRIIPGTIRSVIHNEHPVIRSDGSYIRDYIYVKDAVAAYMLLAEKIEDEGIHGEAFNFSNEIQITVLELTKKILFLTGREDLEPAILNRADKEIRHQYLSAKKARERLGWQPLYTLEQGLQETIAWYKEFFANF
ncbi:MAG: NAD-dependent epimerase/dehydratase family protein [Nitrospiraceae bacterium]|nr:MAG: NAD-dependent epimerase/dehydratase family protein [Nitrospiraceae bacterium]